MHFLRKVYFRASGILVPYADTCMCCIYVKEFRANLSSQACYPSINYVWANNMHLSRGIICQKKMLKPVQNVKKIIFSSGISQIKIKLLTRFTWGWTRLSFLWEILFGRVNGNQSAILSLRNSPWDLYLHMCIMVNSFFLTNYYPCYFLAGLTKWICFN